MPIFKEVSPWKGLIENSLNMYIDYLHNSKYAQDEHVEIKQEVSYLVSYYVLGRDWE